MTDLPDLLAAIASAAVEKRTGYFLSFNLKEGDIFRFQTAPSREQMRYVDNVFMVVRLGHPAQGTQHERVVACDMLGNPVPSAVEFSIRDEWVLRIQIESKG